MKNIQNVFYVGALILFVLAFLFGLSGMLIIVFHAWNYYLVQAYVPSFGGLIAVAVTSIMSYIAASVFTVIAKVFED